jgi:protein-S-isoprenylcysteine O-methyltransferase Ste14
MDTVRYYLALLLLMTTPGGLLFWFSVHPFIGFWRRLGVRLTLTIHYGLIAVLAAAAFLLRGPLLAVDFGTNRVLIGLAVPVFLVGIVIAFQRRRQLKTKILVGFPEVDPQKYPPKLLTEGIYARIRHPRYVEVELWILAYSLVANNLATYVLFLGSLAWLAIVVGMEEKELRARFGEEYEQYCARVPRFLPKF